MMFEWQRGKMIVSLLLIVFDLVFSHGSRLMWMLWFPDEFGDGSRLHILILIPGSSSYQLVIPLSTFAGLDQPDEFSGKLIFF